MVKKRLGDNFTDDVKQMPIIVHDDLNEKSVLWLYFSNPTKTLRYEIPHF